MTGEEKIITNAISKLIVRQKVNDNDIDAIKAKLMELDNSVKEIKTANSKED